MAQRVGRRWLVPIMVALAPLTASHWTPLHAQSAGGVAIGCLCIDGITGKSDPRGVVHTAEGDWTPWTFKYSKQPGSPARLFVFDRAVPPEPALLTCDEIAAKAQSTGTHLLLAGTLNDLKLQARLFKSSIGGESRFQVDANKLSAEIGRVSSGSRRVGGGTMDLAGAKLYITGMRCQGFSGPVRADDRH